MTLEVPSEPKVYTTQYSTFKGVDFTNDSTNVWRHRSPDAVNMLPDEAGRPFKRTGWKTLITSDDFAEASGISGDITINRCCYFELAGEDIIFIFTNVACFTYKGGELECISTDADILQSYDRTFFFEGNGEAAFYIYGNYKQWKYVYSDEEFSLVENEVTTPTILISTPANGEGGILYEKINLLSSLVAEQFQNNIYFAQTLVSGNLIASIDQAKFLSQHQSTGSYSITYNGSTWKINDSTISDPKTHGISYGSGTGTIRVTYDYRVCISAKIDTSVYARVRVFVPSADYNMDTELEVITGRAPAQDECTLYEGDKVSYIVFHDKYTSVIDGEDAIKVIYPRVEVTETEYEDITSTAVARTVY